MARQSLRRWAPLFAALSLPCIVASAAATELTAEAQEKLGLATAALQSAQAPAAIAATAEVLDPSSLAKLADDIVAAQAAADASAAEYTRTQALVAADGNMSRKALEAARTQSIADQSKLRQARTQLRVEWGGSFAALDAGALRTRVDALLEGRETLLKSEPLSAPTAAFVADTATLQLAEKKLLDARVLGALPRSSSGVSAAWLLQASSTSLVPGMILTAQLHGRAQNESKQQGVLLPRAAVVRWNGVAWAYVVTDATHFERRAVQALAMTPAGWLVGTPFKAGEKVVTQGVETLIAVDAAPVPAAADSTPAGD
ncbi:hypothetical protein [Dyella tabacisoli]|uniref:Multidrug transporter n=1 Tax=Dyella tabacisoli TaxID=2282381 RepID=A0A369UI89_9GAMM|nr:hypothetical protein [Dyella tabacisoli]RDD80464.1 hypothetical protein DVJ77_16305 [Dyella tabacisoli]